MKITFKKGLLAAIAALTVCSARADEGMWLLQLMKQQNSIDMMKKQGLKLEADDLYNPNGVSLKDAVGIFGGGCTGEIISPEGLILTNHHCGYGAIQQHSSVEHDYLTDGFWAMNRSEELPTPGLKFRFVHRIVDITDLVNAKIKAGEVTEIDALTSPFLNKLAKEELEKSDLKGKPGIEVRALPFYAGNKFYMFYYKVYSDVRMVAAPPSSVGKFGGETDNWMWPRQTAGSQAPDIIFSPALPGFFPLLPDVLSVAERWTFLKEAVPYMDAGLKCWIVQSKHPGMIPGLYPPCWLLYYRRLRWLGWPLPYQIGSLLL